AAGAIAYLGVSNAESGLHLVDISAPSAPARLSMMDSEHGAARDVVVVGGIAYVGEGASYIAPGLRMFDITNPLLPEDITEYTGSWAPVRLAVANQHAYIVDAGGYFGNSGFVVLDIGTPGRATEVGRYRGVGRPHRVFGARDVVYVADGEQLTALDVADSAAPRILDFMEINEVRDGVVRVVDVSDDGLSYTGHLYLAVEEIQFQDWSNWQLRIIDASDPRHLENLALFDNGDGGYRGGGVDVEGDRAYVTLARTDEDTDFIVFDVRDPANPSELNRATIPDITWRLVIQENIAYVAGDTNGVHTFALPTDAAPVLLKTYDTPGAAFDIGLVDTVALVADGSDGLWVLDMQDPANPSALDWVRMPSTATAVHALSSHGDGSPLAFVTDLGGGLRVLDASDPRNVLERSSFNTPGQAQDLFVSEDNVIYVADGDGGLYIFRYPPCYRLQLSTDGSGSVPARQPSASSGCPVGQYTAGAMVTLTAAPATGWHVAGWRGTDHDSQTGTSNSVTMPAADHFVTVDYAQSCFTLALLRDGEGALPVAVPSKSGVCVAGQYVVVEEIQLTAAPATYWQVSGWDGADESGAELQNVVTMPAADHTVRVIYVPQLPEIGFLRP
ncbi:MAG: hypothetical protein KDD78_20760, partial [Caldilineaceae bacterium]|nr:hypothetical protein [Caldilineaceae bacterium]